MYILDSREDSELGEVFRLNDGREVFVSEYNVGFVSGHPSGVDYYMGGESGYGCKSAREIALVYASQTDAWMSVWDVDIGVDADEEIEE